MQIKLFILKLSLASLTLLTGCRDKLPQEDFHFLPQSGFPKLGYTPDMPALPNFQDAETSKKNLMADTLTSTHLQEETLSHLQTAAQSNSAPSL